MQSKEGYVKVERRILSFTKAYWKKHVAVGV
jgi:hypothetical protein